MKFYSDPKRESETYSLPDCEVWQSIKYAKTLCTSCGEFEVPYESAYASGQAYCPSCEGEADRRYSEAPGKWYWWGCLPGCLPDGVPKGPFATEAESIADAREGMDD